MQKLEEHIDEIKAMTFSLNDSLLVLISNDRIVKLWNSTTNQEMQKLEKYINEIKTMTFLSNDSLLASISNDEIVKLWNSTTNQKVQKLKRHIDWVKAMTFSSNDSLLASASNDKIVRLWDPATGQEVRKLEFKKLSNILSFMNDNKVLLTNQETIEIEQGSRLVLPLKSSPNQTSMKYDNWIRQGSRDLLWLPQEYRNCSSAFNDNTFAFELHSGQVSFIELDFPSKISHD